MKITSFIKRILSAVLVISVFFALFSCAPNQKWISEGDADGDGVYIVSSVGNSNKGKWYCSVDMHMNFIASINIMYDSDFGNLQSFVAEKNGEQISFSSTGYVENGTGFMFFKLADQTRISAFAVDEYKITLTFENATTSITVIPSDVYAAITG